MKRPAALAVAAAVALAVGRVALRPAEVGPVPTATVPTNVEQRAVRPADPSSWRPALEERQSVRRLLLGRAAAEAFFGDEERLLWRQVLALEAGQPAAADAAPPVPEHPQAAQRVAEVQAAWERWERRLAQARVELARLQAAPELSDTQRRQALQAWLGERFDAREQVRVRALLGLEAPR